MLTYATPTTATPTQLALHQEHKARQARMLAAVPKRLEPPKPKAPAVSTVKAADVIKKFRVIEWSLERNFDAHVRAFYHRFEPPTMDTVAADFRAVCPLAWAEIRSKYRRRDVIVWRQAIAHALRTTTGASLPQIGRYLGGFDHTTILHACRTVEAAIKVGDGRYVRGPCGHEFFLRNHHRKGAQ
jgi:hypothetical protein